MKFSAVTAALTIALLSATIASAAGPVTWTVKDMKAAVRALGYPKPHPTKLACRGQGTAAPGGRFDSFRCVATYRHHRRRVFYAAGQGEGGWLCAGATPTTCKLLRRGFVTTRQVDLLRGSLAAVADISSRGYLQNRNETYIPVHFCQQAGTGWACPFTVNGSQVTVTIQFKQARGGYIVSGTSS